MLRFQPQYLRQILIDNTDKAIMEYCSLIYYQLKKSQAKKSIVQQKSLSSITHNPEVWFLLRTINELSLIFKDKNQSPNLKFKSTKFITYLLLMNESEVFDKFELQLLPLIKNICHYNKSFEIQERGYDFFKMSKYYEIANLEEREKIKIIGANFVMFCLQVIYIMNKWMPFQDSDQRSLTSYGLAYKDLVKEGVKFPGESDFIFFNDLKVNLIVKNLQKCEELVKQNRFKISSTRLAKYNAENRSSLSNEISVSNYTEVPSKLQKHLQQKQDVLNEYQKQINEMKDQKQFLIKQFKNQKDVFKQKLIEYETELKKVHYEVKYLRKKIHQYQTNVTENNQIGNKSSQMTEMALLSSSAQSDRSDVLELKQKIKLLTQQNVKLKEENQELQRKIKQNEKKITGEIKTTMNKFNRNKKELIEELLRNDCEENQEFSSYLFKSQGSSRNILKRVNKSNEIFNQASFLPLQNKHKRLLIKSKSQQAFQMPINNEKSNGLVLFEPYYSALSSQLKNRLKRCLLKKKQILYRDQNLQIGVRTSQIDQITLLQQIVITNITNNLNLDDNSKLKQLKNIKIEIINKNNEGEVIIYSQRLFKSTGKLIQRARHRKNPAQERHSCFEIKNLMKDEQNKFEIKIQVNNINFSKGIFARISYDKQFISTKERPETANFGIILPVSKIKLTSVLSKSSNALELLQLEKALKGQDKNDKNESTLIKLFYLNQKVVDSLGKLAKYFGQQKVQIKISKNQKDRYQSYMSAQRLEDMRQISQFSFQVKFMENLLNISFGYVSENNSAYFEVERPASRRENIYKSQQFKGKSAFDHEIKKKLVRMIINYSKTTPYALVDLLAAQFVFILSLN